MRVSLYKQPDKYVYRKYIHMYMYITATPTRTKCLPARWSVLKLKRRRSSASNDRKSSNARSHVPFPRLPRSNTRRRPPASKRSGLLAAPPWRPAASSNPWRGYILALGGIPEIEEAESLELPIGPRSHVSRAMSLSARPSLSARRGRKGSGFRRGKRRESGPYRPSATLRLRGSYAGGRGWHLRNVTGPAG